jgi:hypothetical protein
MSLAHLSLVLALAAPVIVAPGAAEDVVRWNQGAPYARTLDSNGQHYKNIQLSERIYVWASFRHDRFATLANVIVLNDGKERVDVDPQRFTCVCSGNKTLKYEWPFGASSDPQAMVFRFTTLLPGDQVKGVVSFQRTKKCDAAVIRVPVGGTIFEFPFP